MGSQHAESVLERGRVAVINPVQRVLPVDADPHATNALFEIPNAFGGGASSDVASLGSRPAIASNMMATSPTVRAIGPT